MDEIIEKFANAKGIKYEKAAKDYPVQIEKFFAFIQKPLESLDLDDIIAYQRHLKGKYKERTQALFATILRQFFRFTQSRGLTQFDWREIDVPRYVEDTPEYVVQDDFKLLCDIAKYDLVKLCAIRILMMTGVRVSELCDIQRDKIDLTQRLAHVIARKSFKPKLIVWDDETNELVERILKRHNDEYLFCSPNGGKISTRQVERWIEQLRVKAGITKKLTPHSFRHGFTKEQLDVGTDLPAIQQSLGHNNLFSMEKYTKRFDVDIKEKLRDSVRKRQALHKLKLVYERS